MNTFKNSVIGLALLLGSIVYGKDGPSSESLHPKGAPRSESHIRESRYAEISSYIKHHLLHIAVHKRTFFPRHVTHLPYDLQYDPHENRYFINLGDNTQFGKGSKKRVTQAVLYDAHHPQMIARCSQTLNYEHELEITKQLQGPGILKLYGNCTHYEHGKKQYTMYCKHYRAGSLSKVLQNLDAYHLNIRDKILIARQIAEGLSRMHHKGIIHRDLGAANCFLDIAGRGKKRTVDAVIADFGSALYVGEIKNDRPQGHSAYVAPEGLFKDDMKPDGYYKTDVYALGSIFYWLFYEKKPEWLEINFYKKANGSVKERYARYTSILADCNVPHGALEYTRKSCMTIEQRFEKIILEMLSVNPNDRPSAHGVKTALIELSKEV